MENRLNVDPKRHLSYEKYGTVVGSSEVGCATNDLSMKSRGFAAARPSRQKCFAPRFHVVPPRRPSSLFITIRSAV
eukprot:scaffold4707_cov164-Amphora_coffeaeformis.AAC.7